MGSVDSTFVMSTFGFGCVSTATGELFLRKLTKGVNSINTISVCIESKFDLKQWLSDKD